jgi:hypothetical protein
MRPTQPWCYAPWSERLKAASLKGEAYTYLRDPNLYTALLLRLEDAHAAVEATTVEARRRVRMNEDDRRSGASGEANAPSRGGAPLRRTRRVLRNGLYEMGAALLHHL